MFSGISSSCCSADRQTSIPIPPANPVGPSWRSNSISPSTHESHTSRSVLNQTQPSGNMKTVYPKLYLNEKPEISPVQDRPQHPYPRETYSPLQQYQSYYFESRSSFSSSSNRSSVTQSSDLGIEMSRAFLAEKPDLDHILDVDDIGPGQW